MLKTCKELLGKSFSLTLNESDIRVSVENQEQVVPVEDLKKIVETAEDFYFMSGNGSLLLLIPKNSLPCSLVDFRNFLSAYREKEHLPYEMDLNWKW